MSGLSLNSLKKASFSNPCPPVTTKTRVFSDATVAASAARLTVREVAKKPATTARSLVVIEAALAVRLFFGPVADDRYFIGLHPIGFYHQEHHEDQSADSEQPVNGKKQDRQTVRDECQDHYNKPPGDPETNQANMNSQGLPGVEADEAVLLVRVQQKAKEDRADHSDEADRNIDQQRSDIRGHSPLCARRCWARRRRRRWRDTGCAARRRDGRAA